MARRLVETRPIPRPRSAKRLSYMQRAKKIWGNRGEIGPAHYMKDGKGNYFRFTPDQLARAKRAGFREVPAKEFDHDFERSKGELIMWSAIKPKH